MDVPLEKRDFYVALIAICISILSLGVSVLSFWSTSLRVVRIHVEPEAQIQLIQEPETLAFNILFILSSSGAPANSSALRFKSADVTFPDGHVETFVARSLLEESGRGQKNQSRNIPIPMYGGESKTTTVAFQAESQNHYPSWVPGDYYIEIFFEQRGRQAASNFNFSLAASDLKILQRPDTILMVSRVEK